MVARKLTKKQDLFCSFYVECRNGTEAAVSAGYGNDRNCAAVIASKLLKNSDIIARINELDRQMYEALGLSPELIALRMEKIYQSSAKAKRDTLSLKVLKEMRGVLQSGQKSHGIDLNITLNIVNPEEQGNGSES